MELTDKILFVDDDEPIRKAFCRAFERCGFQIDVAKDAWSAMRLVNREEYAVIATDYMMPGLNGLDLTEELKLVQPEATYMLISGNADLPLTLDAVNEYGISYIIPKPWNIVELTSNLRRAIEQSWERRGHAKVAAKMVQASRDLEAKEDTITQALNEAESGIEQSLLACLYMRNGVEPAAYRRVAAYALALGRASGATGKLLEDIERAALLHDVGKIGLPDSVLLKEGALSESEWAIMRSHPQLAGKILGGIDALRDIKPMVEQHNEHWDGSGPLGLRGKGICRGARVVAVVKALDAMMPDNKRESYDAAVQEIRQRADAQFDADIVRALLQITSDEWTEIHERFSSSELSEAA